MHTVVVRALLMSLNWLFVQESIMATIYCNISTADDAPPSNTAVFSLQPPNQVHFIEGQELILGCAKTIPNESLAIQ